MSDIRPKRNGFTLLELMVVIAIILIGAGFLYSTAGVRSSAVYADSTGRQLFTLVQSARQEAIRSGRSVIIQQTDDKLNFRVWRDENANSEVDSDTDVLKAELEIPRQVIISDEIQPAFFTTRGYLVDVSNNPTTMSVTICSPDPESSGECLVGERYSKVSVSVLGLPTIKHGRTE